jgi:hypothetical protein
MTFLKQMQFLAAAGLAAAAAAASSGSTTATPTASGSGSAASNLGPPEFVAPGVFPTSLYKSYYNIPTATAEQPQPVISDPVTVRTLHTEQPGIPLTLYLQHVVYPLELTSAKNIPQVSAESAVVVGRRVTDPGRVCASRLTRKTLIRCRPRSPRMRSCGPRSRR